MPMNPSAMIEYAEKVSEYRRGKNVQLVRISDKIELYLDTVLDIRSYSLYVAHKPDIRATMYDVLSNIHTRLVSEQPPLAFAVPVSMYREEIHVLMRYRISEIEDILQKFFGPVFSIKINSIQYGSYMELEGNRYSYSNVYFDIFVDRGNQNDR